MKISAVILAKNEEAKILRAIQSVAFCDEVIVIDDESTDNTKNVAQQAGALVINHPLGGNFAQQREWATLQTKNEWVLFLDADEEVSSELKDEIINLPTTSPVAYAIPRRDFFWNTELKYGETRKARTSGIVRLIKKDSGVWKGEVHEEFISKQNPGKLKGFINHNSHSSISSFVSAVNRYSSLRAQECVRAGSKPSLFEIIFFPFGKFIYSYFILGGFLDGPAGFAYSFAMSFHSFLVRAKLVIK